MPGGPGCGAAGELDGARQDAARAGATRRARLEAGRRRPPSVRLRHELGLFARRHQLQLQPVGAAGRGGRGGAAPRHEPAARHGRQRDSPVRRHSAEMGRMDIQELRNLCRFESAHGPLRHRRQRRLRRPRRLLVASAATGDPGAARGRRRALPRHARRPHVDARQREQLRARLDLVRDRQPPRQRRREARRRALLALRRGHRAHQGA